MIPKVDKLSKDSLRREFAKDAKEYYSVELFEKQGFGRHTCRVCGKNFWSIPDRETCEDSSHTEYTFFKERPRSIGYVEFWKKFADFFKKNGHTEVKSYPVVSRWRQDLYFTIASIQDFQRIENGKMSFEYNSNPLIVPQICMRFGDIENVGVTGRHFTSFMMAGQHSFNYPKEGYWKDRTIELNYELLTKVLGVKREDLVYNEDVWAMPDFSEFGPSLESFANGSELVNSVFTQFEYTGGVIKELEGKVVDVGWGLDSRLLWFYTGHDTAYEAVFGDTIRKIRPKLGLEMDNGLFKKFAKVSGELDIDEVKNARAKELQLLKSAGISLSDYEKKIRPTQAFYAILDHTRTLLFGIADGSLPSNIGGGYNLRIVLRRSLDFIDKYGLGVDLLEIAKLQADELHKLYPELRECLNSGEFQEVIEIERRRYARTHENARQIVSGLLSKGREIKPEQLRTLYESHGITPQFLMNVAASKGIEIKMPENAYSDIITGDLAKKEPPRKLDVSIPSSVKETKQLYYDFKTEARAKIVFAKSNYLVLDQTPFYPEGGGQAADRGVINGVGVKDVQKVGKAIVHVMDREIESMKEFKVGSDANAKVDLDVRRRLIAHHTSTHLISAASRRILGKHAWQEGARKEPDKAHIDVAHYDKLSEEQVRKIEDLVNDWVLGGIRVSLEELDRGEAEKRYGFEIYQGHGVPATRMRIIVIRTRDGDLIDAEACGGMHAINLESYIGLIKIIDASRISDGIDRIEFVAGEAALDRFRAVSSTLSSAAQRLNSDQFKVTERIAMLDEENRRMRKQLQEYRESSAEQTAATLAESERIVKEMDLPRETLRIIATKVVSLNDSAIVLLKNRSGEVVCVAGEKSRSDALKFIKENSGTKKFVGGGSPKFAEGKMV